jgi:hypothetical protein
MGASVYYRPNALKTYADCGSSSLVDAMKNAFGEPPWTLDATSLPVLRGIKAAGVDIGILAEAIDSNEEGITVWTEY